MAIGELSILTDYLNNTNAPLTLPASPTTFMLDDRYFVDNVAWGNDFEIGNISGDPRSSGTAVEEIVVATNGGRLVIASSQAELTKSWSDPAKSDGDYGFKYSGLALYDIDNDGYDEIFTVGMAYTDGSVPDDNNSRLLIFDSPISNLQTATPTVIDLGQAGCMGLWVGPALGQCSCLGDFDVIVGRAQTFAVYDVDPSTFSLALRYVSEGLGSALGAFDGIAVQRKVSAPNNKLEDWLYIGSSAYFYGYRSQPYSLIPH